DERVRATPSSLAQMGDAAAGLTAALDRVEASLQRFTTAQEAADDSGVRRTHMHADAGAAVRTVRLNSHQEGALGERSGESAAALVRRAIELRDEVRLLVRASESDLVYFVELRGRGVFLRAAPVDVSAIIRDLLLDRMRATVLTSATLTVDGTFEYVRRRL